MPNIRETRMAATRAQLDRLTEHREATIARLIKLDAKVKTARRQLARYEKLAAQPAKPKPELPTLHIPYVPPVERLIEAEVGIPTFLQRKAEGDRKDAEARAQIQAEQAAGKRKKSLARVGKVLADKSGERKRMPLTGKAALEAIRG
jgi:multidrug resistance efflux pump